LDAVVEESRAIFRRERCLSTYVTREVPQIISCAPGNVGWRR